MSPENLLFIHLAFLQVVDNTFMTNWRRIHLLVHAALKLELCCFSFELVPRYRFISKDAVLLIITEWPTSMSSLTSLIFYFPNSHEPRKVNLLFSHFSCPSCKPQKEFLFLCVSHSSTDMDKVLFVFPLDQQLWPWTKEHVVPMKCIFNS